MANAVCDEAKENGADAGLLSIDAFCVNDVAKYDVIVFGCPAMGDEVLEENVFAPAFSEIETKLKGKNVAFLVFMDGAIANG